jgi:hypothetical protein
MELAGAAPVRKGLHAPVAWQVAASPVGYEEAVARMEAAVGGGARGGGAGGGAVGFVKLC